MAKVKAVSAGGYGGQAAASGVAQPPAPPPGRPKSPLNVVVGEWYDQSGQKYVVSCDPPGGGYQTCSVLWHRTGGKVVTMHQQIWLVQDGSEEKIRWGNPNQKQYELDLKQASTEHLSWYKTDGGYHVFRWWRQMEKAPSNSVVPGLPAKSAASSSSRPAKLAPWFKNQGSSSAGAEESSAVEAALTDDSSAAEAGDVAEATEGDVSVCKERSSSSGMQATAVPSEAQTMSAAQSCSTSCTVAAGNDSPACFAVPPRVQACQMVSSNEEFICSVCLELIIDPVVLQCSHFFCRDCLCEMMTWNAEGSPLECPSCRTEFTKDQIQKDSAIEIVRRCIEGLQVKCAFMEHSQKADSSTDSLPRDHAARHLRLCCEWEGVIRDVEHHLKEKCKVEQLLRRLRRADKACRLLKKPEDLHHGSVDMPVVTIRRGLEADLPGGKERLVSGTRCIAHSGRGTAADFTLEVMCTIMGRSPGQEPSYAWLPAAAFIPEGPQPDPLTMNQDLSVDESGYLDIQKGTKVTPFHLEWDEGSEETWYYGRLVATPDTWGWFSSKHVELDC